MEKKQNGDWYIAASLFAIAGFLIPFVLYFVLGMITPFFFGSDINGNFAAPPATVAYSLFYGVVGVVFTVLGVYWGVRHIKNTYIIERPGHVALLATACFVAFAAISDAVWGYFAGQSQPLSAIVFELNSAEWLVDTAIFYLLTKKMLTRSA